MINYFGISRSVHFQYLLKEYHYIPNLIQFGLKISKKKDCPVVVCLNTHHILNTGHTEYEKGLHHFRILSVPCVEDICI